MRQTRKSGSMADKKRLIVGMSGASGAPLAVEVLRQLRESGDVEAHLIVTQGAMLTLRQETDISPGELYGMADAVYDPQSIGAAPASGSFKTIGMIVVPCSMKTVAGIVSGYSDNLLLRAADVTLKERRRLVLAARESPLSTVHLRNLHEASMLGAVIMPPVPAFYRHPGSVDDCVRHMAGRMLEQFGICAEGYEWTGM